MVPTSDGSKISLKISLIRTLTGPAFIFRDNYMRHIVVKFSVRGRDLGSAIEEAQQKVNAAVHLQEGYKMSWNCEL
jgi:heavy metal efflux system protein